MSQSLHVFGCCAREMDYTCSTDYSSFVGLQCSSSFMAGEKYRRVFEYWDRGGGFRIKLDFNYNFGLHYLLNFGMYLVWKVSLIGKQLFSDILI